MTDDSSCDGVAYLLLFSQPVKMHCWRITAEEESLTPSVCQGLFVTLALSCASTYIFHPVKCRDSCRTLPDSVWVPDEANNITTSSLQCGLEHSEKHKDGNDHSRYSESTLTSKNELHTAKCSTCEINTPDRLVLPWTGSLYQRTVISEQNLRNEYFSLQEKWVYPFKTFKDFQTFK